MKAKTQVLAIIPARGGSKGIPGKNVKHVAGSPLLKYSIAHALQTPSVTRTVVSTDSPEVASVATDADAEVVWRPADISCDTATSESALLHALEYLREREKYEPELVLFLQPTSPLRRPEDSQLAIEKLQREGADSLFSACPVHGFVWSRNGEELSSVTYDYQHRPRRQDSAEALIENGSIYVFKPRVLRNSNNRLGGKIAVYEMDPLDSFQIDEPSDLQLIEKLLTLSPTRRTAPDLSRVRLLVLDFDGVLTNNQVIVNQDGVEAVQCHRGDGWGIARLKEAGVEVIVLSAEVNATVGARCRKLGIEYVQNCDHKLSALKELVQTRSFHRDEVAYVGNDVNDLDCLRWVGVPIAVADAVSEVLAVASLVTSRSGGHGAVREIADSVLSSRR